MPREHKKRGRREERKRKRKREEEEYNEASKRQNAGANLEVELSPCNDHEADLAEYVPITKPGEMPFYGLLDEEEQEYFKRADSILELNQFGNAEEQELFLANVFKEINGKELKIASSQSCSRLMERLIIMSTPARLKALFEKFAGHFLHLAQHRFASHCCEALFLQAAPVVSEEVKALQGKQPNPNEEKFSSMETYFLNTLQELEGNLGYLITDKYASHALRVLLVVLSGRPFRDAQTRAIIQSKRKETITTGAHTMKESAMDSLPRAVPNTFQSAVRDTISSIVTSLDSTSLRALACHPVANPVMQLLLDLEFLQSRKTKTKDAQSLFRKLLPDDPPVEGTESASFFNGLLYDPIGSHLLEIIITKSPGKTFKILYRNLCRDRLPNLAKNETASYVVIRALERLSREDLQDAVRAICPLFRSLVDRSQTSTIRCLVERCQTREVDVQPIATALDEAYGKDPKTRLLKLLKVDSTGMETMAEERRKQLQTQDAGKAHGSLLAQSMLQAPGQLRELILEGLLATDNPSLLQIARDRTATHVLQSSLTCSSDTLRYRRMVMPRLAVMAVELAKDSIGSRAVDAFWAGSEGLPFLREQIADQLLKSETSLRESVGGRAVWRNWKMDMYKTRKIDWMTEAKGEQKPSKTGIDLARERFVATRMTERGKRAGERRVKPTGTNTIAIPSQG